MSAPTIKQQEYLRRLAQRAGETFTMPSTRAQASREIERMRQRVEASKETAGDCKAQEHREYAEVAELAAADGATSASIASGETRRLAESRDGHTGGAWSDRGFGDYDREASASQLQLLQNLCRRARIAPVPCVDAEAALPAIDLLLARNPGRSTADVLANVPPDSLTQVLGGLSAREREVFVGRFMMRATSIAVARDLGIDTRDVKVIEPRAATRARNCVVTELLAGRLRPAELSHTQASDLGRTL